MGDLKISVIIVGLSPLPLLSHVRHGWLTLISAVSTVFAGLLGFTGLYR